MEERREKILDIEKEIAGEICNKPKEHICNELGYDNEECVNKSKDELCKELKIVEEKLTNVQTSRLKHNLIEQGDCITQIAELNTKIKLLKDQIASYELKDDAELLKFKDDESKKKENDKYLCDIEKSDLYIDKLAQEARKYNEGYVEPGLGGGSKNNYSFKNELSAILNGGIIPKLKKKYSKMIKNE